MTLLWHQESITNWSLTERSPCYVFKAQDTSGINYALTTARAQGVSVITHGAGHSYTDAALNTNGVLIDMTGMNRILAWDAEQGIMQVEPGVTLRDMVRVSLADYWWPPVTPSTADATIGGCVAMNVNGKNAWKCGSFGEHLLSLTILLASGNMLTLSPEGTPELFRAFVGGVGLLGIIISITLQLQRIPSRSVDVLRRPAASIGEILTIFHEEEPSADFLEAWIDGFSAGGHLGRGIVMCTKYSNLCDHKHLPLQAYLIPDQLQTRLAHSAGKIGRPAVEMGMHIANAIMYWWSKWWNVRGLRHKSLFHSTYYSPATFIGYRALLPQGIETFQAFVPYSQAQALFEEILRCSQEHRFMPLWCIIKQHRRDPFLLSYQVDGFSLEVNYQIVPQTIQRLHTMLRELMELVIVAGGRFYLAKDSLLTHTLYRRSIGDTAVEAFLKLKHLYDPEMLFQSNLFRRVFQPPLQ